MNQRLKRIEKQITDKYQNHSGFKMVDPPDPDRKIEAFHAVTREEAAQMNPDQFIFVKP
ncbi:MULTISPECIES: hypothetical protein [unclassified Oceanispirochaeta]|uniref:hypothetical protein n=1 Tax=unclassified Oceanispirochaeta TaxID=2635722 RepID=UPI0013149110|nr:MULTISPECIES: hypothetical protein [unclassified Oceanispirochaeta]MBF9018956.1 hypothetical protein [Oceanispirochaeta sp. M2]NPD75452.1 hypothetical protein [Oceanispirochaeta sp. M1]